MPECAFAELDRVVRKCLLSSLNSFADVVVFVVVVVNREREVLPGMMRDALRFGRGAAQKLLRRRMKREEISIRQKETERQRERDGDKTTFKEIVLRALYLLVRSVSFFFFFVSAG